MKSVFTAAFQEEAIVIRSLLASAGIGSELLADRMLDVNPYFSIEPKGVQVVVADEDAADAEALVAEFRARRRGEAVPS